MDQDGVTQIGIVGVGGHGMGNVYPHVQNNPRMRIRAVCDLVPKQIEIGAKAFEPDYTTQDYREMLADPRIDAIVSSTHDPYHAPIAIGCMKDGKNVFVEKPMGTTLQQCQECIRTEKETGKFVMVGLNRRFAPMYVDVRKAMAEATIPPELAHRGRKAPVITYRIADDPRNHASNPDPALKGRINREICHIFDVTTWLIGGEPTTIYAAGEDSRGVITVTYDNGGIVSIVEGGISHISMPKESMTILAEGLAIQAEMFLRLRIASDDCWPEKYYHGFDHGTPGEVLTEPDRDPERIYFSNMQAQSRFWRDQGVYSAPTAAERERRWHELTADGHVRAPQENMTFGGLDKGHYGEIEAFRRAVLKGGPSPIGAADGARAFVMGQAAAESMAAGKVVAIDHSLYRL